MLGRQVKETHNRLEKRMSAPDTNVEKQAEKHSVPLFGMGTVVAFAGALLLLLMVWLSATGNEPGEAEGGVTPAVTSDS